MSQQLKKLLQTYFGAMCDCLVCSSTVGATNFTATVSTSSSGIPWESIPELTETAEKWHWSSGKRKADEAYYFIIDQGIDDSRLDLAS